MFKFSLIFFLIINVALLNPQYNHIQSSKEALISNLINYFDFDFFNNETIKKYPCLEELKTDFSFFEIIYLSSSLNKNDINTYKTCINYNESIGNEKLIYLTALVNQKKSLYDVLTMKETKSEYLTGICFMKGCKEEDYQQLLLNVMNKVFDTNNVNNNNDTNITISENDTIINKTNKFSEDDIKIYIFDNNKKDSIIITILELLPFIFISIYIFIALIYSFEENIIISIFAIFCCKRNQLKNIKTRTTISRNSKLKNDKNQFSPNEIATRMPSISTIKSNVDNFQKTLDILFNIEINFTSLSSYQKGNQLSNNTGSSYINGLKGIFMIFLLFGNVYMALYGCFATEKNKKNFYLQLKNFLFFLFYIGIRYAPKMLLCAGGFSLFFKFMFFLDGKMDDEIEIIKQNEEGNKELNSSSSSNRFFNKLKKNKEKPILSYKYLFEFYWKQMNKYMIYILFLCFFIFSFNKTVSLIRIDHTPLWEYFNEKMLESSKKYYYLLPLLIGFKSHLIPVISNNEEINLLDYFYLPFQEIFYFLITSFIIFIGYRNNYKIDRFFKVIGVIIFIYRIFYYSRNHLDNKDYFNYNEYGKFYNSILYNYNFHIIGIIFGMINYVLLKGYSKGDLIYEKIYLLSAFKFLGFIKRKRRKSVNCFIIICFLIIIIPITFFQQIIASCYGDNEEEIINYKNNIFSQIILFFDADLFVLLSYLMAFYEYIKGENKLNNFLCLNFWTIFNNFYFTYIMLINPVILYIIYTTDTKIIFNLSHCFLYTFICGILVVIITILMYSIFELPFKKFIQHLMPTRENSMKSRLTTIENNQDNFMDNVTASITDMIDDGEEEEKEEK